MKMLFVSAAVAGVMFSSLSAFAAPIPMSKAGVGWPSDAPVVQVMTKKQMMMKKKKMMKSKMM